MTTTMPPDRSRRVPLTLLGGFLMGAADIVPGVSGGTIALVLGIYPNLVAQIRIGAGALGEFARGRFGEGFATLKRVDWWFLVPLGVGLLTAIVLLASALEHLLETQPVALSALFLGLVAGSIVLAAQLLDAPAPEHLAVAAVAAVVTFLALGLRAGQVDDPSLLLVFGAGAIAICAMILPGVSGSFLLLLMGMYEVVIGAVSDRDLAIIAVFGLGAVLGLAAFSTLLDRMLAKHHDRVLAVLLGLLVGSTRVLWPWPAGADGVGDTGLGAPVAGDVPMVLGLFVVGVVIVLGVGLVGRQLTGATFDENVHAAA